MEFYRHARALAAKAKKLPRQTGRQLLRHSALELLGRGTPERFRDRLRHRALEVQRLANLAKQKAAQAAEKVRDRTDEFIQRLRFVERERDRDRGRGYEYGA